MNDFLSIYFLLIFYDFLPFKQNTWEEATKWEERNLVYLRQFAFRWCLVYLWGDGRYLWCTCEIIYLCVTLLLRLEWLEIHLPLSLFTWVLEIHLLEWLEIDLLELLEYLKTWEIYLWFGLLELYLSLHYFCVIDWPETFDCQWFEPTTQVSQLVFFSELFQLLTIFADLKVPKCKVPFFACVFHCHGAFGSSLCRDFRQISNREG